MIYNLVTPGDLAKDSGFAVLGFSPAAIVPHVETAIVFGLLNLVVVIVFRVIELRMKYGKKSPKREND